MTLAIGPIPGTDEKSHVKQNIAIQQLFKSVGYTTGQALTFEQFGTVGDGTSDDTIPISNAIAAAQATGGTLYGTRGKTYKWISQITISSSVRIDFGGATLKFVNSTASSAGIVVTGSVLSTTTPASSAAAGARTVSVTSATNMVVGGYLAFDIWRSSPNLANYKHMAKIVDVSGTTITIDSPLPYAWATGSFGGNSASVAVITALKNTHISNAIIDLASATNTGGYGFVAEYCADSSFTGLILRNHPATDANSFYTLSCAHCRYSIATDTCGAGTQAVDASFNGLTDCTIERLDSSNSGVFGPQIVKCSYCDLNNLNSEGAHGRSLKFASNLFLNVNNIVANNCSAAGATGLAITDATSDCSFNNIVANGHTFGGTGEGIWLSDQSNCNNRFSNWEASYSTTYNVAVNTSDTGNVFVNGRTNDITLISNTGNAKFIGLNGKDYTPLTSLTLVNGQNDNVALPGTDWVGIVGPTLAFSITGFTTPTMDGAKLKVFNFSAQTLTLKHATGSTAGNQINTISGGNLTPILFFELIYSSGLAVWIVCDTR